MKVQHFITHNGHWEYMEYTSRSPTRQIERHLYDLGTQKRQEVFKLNQEG